MLKLALASCELISENVETIVATRRFWQLQELNLRHNEIETLPSALFRLPHLQSLKLDHNRIAELPAIDSTSGLKVLTIAHNQLFCVPASIRNLRATLQILSLSDNKICFLPPELA